MSFPPSREECAKACKNATDLNHETREMTHMVDVDPVAVERSKQMKWDNYLMAFARLASANTKCGSRAIGAAVVIDRRVVATGYNGPACGMDRCSDRWREFANENDVYDVSGLVKVEFPDNDFCPRRIIGYPSGQGLEICVAGHAERNALNQCSRLGISTLGASLYAYCGIPCKDCAIEIVNSGIAEVVCLKKDYEYDALGRKILEAGGVTIREIPDMTDLVIEKVY